MYLEVPGVYLWHRYRREISIMANLNVYMTWDEIKKEYPYKIVVLKDHERNVEKFISGGVVVEVGECSELDRLKEKYKDDSEYLVLPTLLSSMKFAVDNLQCATILGLELSQLDPKVGDQLEGI